ncbi:MAG: hypothetical protein AB1714_21605 [Acidobacteriota bacterium]
MDDPDRDDSGRFRPADTRTQEEVGGVLERAFAREGGREPNEAEAQRYLQLADEAEKKAKEAEVLAGEADAAAVRSAERYATTQSPSDQDSVERWKVEAETHRREADSLRKEAERMRQYVT